MPLTGNIRKDIAIIYTGVFGRAPEKQGLDYWYQQAVQNGWDLKDLAENMYAAATSFPAYQNLTNPQELVETLYENVLGKLPQEDPEGILYWTSLLQEGDKTAGETISDIIYTAITQYPDHPATQTLLNRADASLIVAEKFEDVDLDNDGVIEDSDFQVFEKLVKVVKNDPEDIQKLQLYIDDIAHDPSQIDTIFSYELEYDNTNYDYYQYNSQTEHTDENNQSSLSLDQNHQVFLAHVFEDNNSLKYIEDIYVLNTGNYNNLCITENDVYTLPEREINLTDWMNGTVNINTLMEQSVQDALMYLPEDYLIKVENDGEYYGIEDVKLDYPYTITYQVKYLKDLQKGIECENSGNFKKIYTLEYDPFSGAIDIVYVDKQFIDQYQYLDEIYGVSPEDMNDLTSDIDLNYDYNFNYYNYYDW